MMEKRKDMILVVVTALAIFVSILVGCVPNVAAIYDYDNGIDYITLTFDDGTNETIAEDSTYNLTVNQTSVTYFYIYANFVYYHLSNTTYDYLVSIKITDPNRQSTYIFAEKYGAWTLSPIGSTYSDQGVLASNETYNFTERGTYTVEMEHWLLTNGTLTNADDYNFEIVMGAPSDPSELDMGDQEFLEMTLGFFGVIGFIAAPVFTAKLMGHKDPILMIGLSLMGMITFGVMIYVFLLGGM